MKIILVAILVGAVGGLVAALCGVGGGIIMVPAFVMALGMAQKSAVATSLAIIGPTAVVATLRNHSANPNLIDWKVFVFAAVAAVVVAFLGSDMMRAMSDERLTRIFGLVLVAVGLKTLIFP